MVTEKPWMSTDEAADFLGIGKTKLYALTREGKIPARRLGKKWTYERELLAEWLRADRSIEGFFMKAPAKIENNADLRDPQREGYARAAEYFAGGGTKAIIQMPVGCGKSGLVAIL